MGHAANKLRVRGRSGIGGRPRRGLFGRHLTDFVIAGVVLLVSGAGVSLYLETQSRLGAAQERKRAAEARVGKLVMEIAKVEREAEKLRNDPDYIEAVARASLGLVREGDVVIRLGPEVEEPAYRLRRASSGSSAQTGSSSSSTSNVGLTHRGSDSYSEASH